MRFVFRILQIVVIVGIILYIIILITQWFSNFFPDIDSLANAVTATVDYNKKAILLITFFLRNVGTLLLLYTFVEIVALLSENLYEYADVKRFLTAIQALALTYSITYILVRTYEGWDEQGLYAIIASVSFICTLILTWIYVPRFKMDMKVEIVHETNQISVNDEFNVKAHVTYLGSDGNTVEVTMKKPEKCLQLISPQIKIVNNLEKSKSKSCEWKLRAIEQGKVKVKLRAEGPLDTYVESDLSIEVN